MEVTKLTEVAKQRENALKSLHNQAEAARIHADALDALVELISAASVPVAHFEPHWKAVETRLRKDAVIARQRVGLAQERVEDIQRSIDARENWLPGRHPA